MLQAYESDCYEIRDSKESKERDDDWITEEDERTGFIAEVTLSYPTRLHKKHKSFPLAPEKLAIKEGELSSYQMKCKKKLRCSSKSEKLIGTFYDRKRYVLHAANLKLYLKLGLKLRKVHRVLSFTESNFLKPFLDFCTARRSEAKSDFEKRLFKLVSNSNFGKFIENSSKYLDMKLVRNEKEAKFWISSPLFHSYRIVSDNLLAIFLHRKNNVIKQAYAIGFSILDLSKEFMFASYYNEIRPLLGESCEVLFSDTDSLFLKCRASDPFTKLESILDSSNFSPSHPLFRTDRKSQLGYFKSEVGDKKIEKFVGLRSKCYAFQTETGEVDLKCKGLSKNFKAQLGITHFERCLQEITMVEATQKLLRSKNNQIQLIHQRKTVLSSFDDKHFLLNCGICSVPFGSRYISKYKDYCVKCRV